MKRLKVYYVIDAYDGPSGGTERQLRMLIRGMQAEGHDARLFVLRHTAYTLEVTDFPCPIECLQVNSIRSLRSLKRMLAFRKRLVEERPDVVHAFFNDAAMLIPLYCRGVDTRVFTSRRDMGFWYNGVNLPILRMANRRVDGVICNCKAVADHVKRREHVPADRMLVIYNALAPEVLAPAATAAEPALAPPDAGELCVCLVANLRPIKRVEDFIRAAALVSQSFDHYSFLIVGEPLIASYEAQLKCLADELRVTGKLKFLDRVEEPFQVVRQCQVGVLSSESEGLSNSILEYMAAGLPVVCSAVGGNPELVEHGDNGYLYPQGEVEALASHLLQLGTDAELRGRMGAASLRRAGRFTPEAMVHAHLHAYRGGGGIDD